MSDEKMCPISLDQFLEKRLFDVDVFIQLTTDKFILFGRAGAVLDPSHLEKYKQKNVNYFFIRASDFGKLADQAVSIAGITIGQKSIASSAKINALENACTAMFNEIRVNGFDEKALGHANLVSIATMNLVASYPNLADMMIKLVSSSVRDERHAILVSAMASMLGVTMGWKSTSTLERLALGGLLHDLGVLNLPADISAKNHRDLGPDDFTIYKTHCEFGRESLSRMRVIPDDVKLMVYEHHEFADGSGYPRGIKDLFISPYGRVLALANTFTELVFDMGSAITKEHVDRAIDMIEKDFAGKFNKETVKALKVVIGRDAKKAVA